MVNDAKRFLGLNALLHGYTPEEAFSGDVAEIFSLGDKETATLFKRLNGIEYSAPSNDPLVMALLNFMRNTDYAFLSLRGQYILRLQDFADDDFNGNTEKGMANGVLANILRDYAPIATEGVPYITDGVLCCTESEFKRINKAMQDAYKLLTRGPSKLSKSLNLLLRQHTSLEAYVPFSSIKLLTILDGLVDANIHPVACQQTFLRTSDLLSVYKGTGCILAYCEQEPSSVNWLLDVKGSDDLAASVKVPLSSLRNHLLNSIQDLEGSYAVTSRNKAVYSVCYPGD